MKRNMKGIIAGLAVIIVMLVAAIPVLAASDTKGKAGAKDESGRNTMVTAVKGVADAGDDTDMADMAREAVAPETATSGEDSGSLLGKKAFAAALVVGVAAFAGAISMGWAISKSVDGIARQPEAEGKIRTTLMLGLVFIETAIIYALVVAILIIFVL